MRILLKLSGETLSSRGIPNCPKEKDFSSLDIEVIDSITDDIIEVYNSNIEIGIVVGGGNFFRARDTIASGIDRVEADKIGMLATIQNAIVLSNIFDRKRIPNQAFSSVDMNKVLPVFDAISAKKILTQKRIAIFGGGTGNPFFTTDTAAVLRACEIDADLMLKATKVDGVYDTDPINNQNAKFFPKITYQDILKSKLKVMDLTAVSLAMDNNLKIKVFNITIKGNLKKAIYNNNIGTRVE